MVAPKDRLKKFNEKVKQYQITFFQRRLFKDVGQYHQVTKWYIKQHQNLASLTCLATSSPEDALVLQITATSQKWPLVALMNISAAVFDFTCCLFKKSSQIILFTVLPVLNNIIKVFANFWRHTWRSLSNKQKSGDELLLKKKLWSNLLDIRRIKMLVWKFQMDCLP